MFHLQLFVFNSYQCKLEIYSVKVGVTELPTSWERAANSACNPLFLWVFNCICLLFPLMLRT